MSNDDTHGPDDPKGDPVGPFPGAPQHGGIRPDPAFDALPPEPALTPPPDPPSDWNAAADAHDLPTREPRLAALGRFAFPPEPPLDDEGEAARDQHWTTRVIAVATVFLLVFNAASLQSWSRQQEPGWISDTVGDLSAVWSDRLALLAADQPRQALRDAWAAAADWRFIGAKESESDA